MHIGSDREGEFRSLGENVLTRTCGSAIMALPSYDLYVHPISNALYTLVPLVIGGCLDT